MEKLCIQLLTKRTETNHLLKHEILHSHIKKQTPSWVRIYIYFYSTQYINIHCHSTSRHITPINTQLRRPYSLSRTFKLCNVIISNSKAHLLSIHTRVTFVQKIFSHSSFNLLKCYVYSRLWHITKSLVKQYYNLWLWVKFMQQLFYYIMRKKGYLKQDTIS